MKLIGIDFGGTSCRLALCNPDGTVVSSYHGKGCNPNMVGLSTFQSLLKEGLGQLLAKHGGFDAAIECLCLTAAGITTGDHIPKTELFLQQLLPNCKKLYLCSDTMSPLQAALSNADGGVLIAGTGVVGLFRKGGKMNQLGGWGYLLDAGGSGFHLGRDGWTAVLEDYYGIGPKTMLTEKYIERLGEDPHSAIRQLYANVNLAPSFAPVVLECAQAGDAVALEILRHNAGCLAHLADHMAMRLGNDAKLAPAGGLLTGQPVYFELMKSMMTQPVTWVNNGVPAVCGAAMLAAREAGLPENPEFRYNYLASC